MCLATEIGWIQVVVASEITSLITLGIMARQSLEVCDRQAIVRYVDTDSILTCTVLMHGRQGEGRSFTSLGKKMDDFLARGYFTETSNSGVNCFQLGHVPVIAVGSLCE